MLLRRVIEHVKAQNWTAVGLDFVVVVVGVFIGIQVSNWNDTHSLNRQRDIAIDRLHDEAVQIDAYLSRQLNFVDGLNDLRAELIPALQDGSWRNLENIEDKTYALQIGLAPAAAPPRTTYDELVSTGFFAEIGDAQLRKAIAEYYAALFFLEGQIEYQRTILTELGQWHGDGTKAVFDPEARGERIIVYDLEVLSRDESYLQYLINGHAVQRNGAEFWRSVYEASSAMCSELMRFSGKQCTVNGSEAS